MSLRPPGRPGSSALPPTGLSALDYEIAGEQASALGRAGRRVEESLAALAACGDDAGARESYARDAAEAVWTYFVQREAMGLRRHDDAIRIHRIPKDILARLGAV